MKNASFHRIKRRHTRVRRKIEGTTARPRLVLKRTSRHLYAQVVDDSQGLSIVQLSTTRKGFSYAKLDRSNKEAARALGAEIAEVAKAKGVEQVVFDRGGFVYHGVIKEFAEAARQAGLAF